GAGRGPSWTGTSQFSVGVLLTWSITSVSSGAFFASNFKPSCSRTAVKILGAASAGWDSTGGAGPPAPGGPPTAPGGGRGSGGRPAGPPAPGSNANSRV